MSRNHSCVVLAVCLGSLYCWKVNLHLNLRYWVLRRRLSSRMSLYFALFIFPQSWLVSQSLLLKNIPTAWRLTLCRRNACHSGQSWFHQTRESCLSWSESPLGAFWQTPSRLSCAFYWGVAYVWPLYHKCLIGGVLQRWLSFWKVSHLHRWTPELCQCDQCGFLVTSLTKAQMDVMGVLEIIAYTQ